MEEEEHEDVDFIVPEKKQKQSKQEDDEEGEGTNSTFTFEKQAEIEKTIDNRKFDDDNNFNRRKYAHEGFFSFLFVFYVNIEDFFKRYFTFQLVQTS